MRRFTLILWSVMPALILVLSGIALQKLVVTTLVTAVQSFSFSSALYVNEFAQFLLVILSTFLLAVFATRPLPRLWACGYIVVAFAVLIFHPLFLGLGYALISRHIPHYALNYLTFATRPVELLSWILVFSVGLFNLVVTLLNKQKKI